MREESIDAYESTAELTKRMEESDLAKYPGVQETLEKASGQISEGKGIDSVSLDDFPADAIPSFLYSMVRVEHLRYSR